MINMLFITIMYINLGIFSSMFPQMCLNITRVFFVHSSLNENLLCAKNYIFCFIYLQNDNIRELCFFKLWETALKLLFTPLVTSHTWRKSSLETCYVTYLVNYYSLIFHLSITLFSYRHHQSLLLFLFLIILTLRVGEIDDTNATYNLYK